MSESVQMQVLEALRTFTLYPAQRENAADTIANLERVLVCERFYDIAWSQIFAGQMRTCCKTV